MKQITLYKVMQFITMIYLVLFLVPPNFELACETKYSYTTNSDRAVNFFFLEHIGELRNIALIEEQFIK
jgi:hypothetical protein